MLRFSKNFFTQLKSERYPPTEMFTKSRETVLMFYQFLLKGTVRPDWICMRVVSLESPLKGHQPL
jgi:hypothetical protein